MLSELSINDLWPRPVLSSPGLCADLYKRSLGETSGQHLCKTSLGNISFWDLCTSSLYKSSLGKIYVRDLLARSPQQTLYKISFWDLCTSSLKELSEQDLHKRPFGKISATDLYAMSLYKISKTGAWQDLCQDLYKRSIGKISVRGLFAISQQISAQRFCTRSLYEMSAQALYHKSSLGMIYVRDLLARSLQQISMQCLCTIAGSGFIAVKSP